MFPGIGTLVNALTVLLGAAVGVAAGHRLPHRTRHLVTDALGLVTLLIAASSARLARAGSGWRRTLVVLLGTTLVLALLVFAAFPLGPGTIAAGLLPLYLAGAFSSIIAGNGLAIVMSLMSERFGLALPRPVRLLGLTLGIGGLVSIPATYGRLAIGIAERIPMYSFLGWAAVTGIALLVTEPNPPRAPGPRTRRRDAGRSGRARP